MKYLYIRKNNTIYLLSIIRKINQRKQFQIIKKLIMKINNVQLVIREIIFAHDSQHLPPALTNEIANPNLLT